MAETITHGAVVRIAREVFPGLVEANITVTGPDPERVWDVTINIFGLLKVSIWAWAREMSCLGQADHGVMDMELAARSSLSTEDEVRRFLTECRDSFVANVTHGLTAALGPVRVLPKNEGLDQVSIVDILETTLDPSSFPVKTIFTAYTRRHNATAKPAGS